MAIPGRSALPEGNSDPRCELTLTNSLRLVAASRSEAYAKLLDFIDTTGIYQTDRLFGLIPSEGYQDLFGDSAWADYFWLPGFFEAKAILLGRMGRHENALELYVYRLHDYLKAEEYTQFLHLPATSLTRFITGTVIVSLILHRPRHPQFSSPSSGSISNRGCHLPPNRQRAQRSPSLQPRPSFNQHSS